ncbi:MAG: hypothetical protein A2060_00835 [Planctomycetes bacterium GWA2_50_13]|nr:MAG: hypothetical protein A2060_00835 [Planctomycetes bacterium GWA2_50_13]
MFAIAMLTIFSLVVFPGYWVFAGDQKNYVPAIFQALNPALFQNDYSLTYNHGTYTLFDELIIFMMNTLKLNIFYALFFLYIVVKFIYLYSVYKIAIYFTGDKTFSILSTLLFMSGLLIYGIPIRTPDIYLVPRLISLSLNLLFLACIFNKQWLLSALSLCIGLLAHPITSFPFVVFFYFDVFFLSNKEDFKWKLVLSAMPVLSLIFLLSTLESAGSEPFMAVFEYIDDTWEGILKQRIPFIFITGWNHAWVAPLFGYHYLNASLCFLVVSYLELDEIFGDARKKQYLFLLFTIPLFLLMVSFITVDILKIHVFAELQIARSLCILKIFTTLLFSYFGYNRIKTHPKDVFYNFLLIGIITSFIFEEFLLFIFFPMFLLVWINRRRKRFNLSTLIKVRMLTKDGLPVTVFMIVILLAIVIIPSMLVLMLKVLIHASESCVLAITVSCFSALIVNWKEDIVIKRVHMYVVLILLTISIITYLPGFTVHPLYLEDSGLVETCDWIKNNTSEQDVFITEPFCEEASIPVRLTCYRNLFYSCGDGGATVFSRNYAIEWEKRFKLAERLKEDMGLLVKISKDYDVNYVLSDHKLEINYPLVFNNTRYCIYKIN